MIANNACQYECLQEIKLRTHSNSISQARKAHIDSLNPKHVIDLLITDDVMVLRLAALHILYISQI